MSAGQIAALVAAGAFVVLVLLMAVPLLKLGRTLDEATVAIRKAHEGSAPLLDDAQTTLWLLTHPESRHLRRVAAVYAHLGRTLSLP